MPELGMAWGVEVPGWRMSGTPMPARAYHNKARDGRCQRRHNMANDNVERFEELLRTDESLQAQLNEAVSAYDGDPRSECDLIYMEKT